MLIFMEQNENKNLETKKWETSVNVTGAFNTSRCVDANEFRFLGNEYENVFLLFKIQTNIYLHM